MRLYTLVGADQHVDPEGNRYTPDEAGGFDFPDEISDLIGGFAVRGRKMWETETERADRLHGMEMARRRDPASMLAALEDNAALNRRVTELMAMLTAAQLGQQAAAPAQAQAAAGDPPGAPDDPPAPQADTAHAPSRPARASKAAKAELSPRAAAYRLAATR